MNSELLLGIRLDCQSLKTIKLFDVNLKTKVEDLKSETAKKINLSKESLEFVYCGCILEDEATLESCGLKNNSMVHVLKRKDPEIPLPPKSISEESMLQLVSAFKSFNENPAFRSALHRLSKRPEVIENIISSSPGLHEDPVAIALFQDPDLMAHFTDIATVKRIAELHPVLLEAAQNMSSAVNEEAHNAATNTSSTSTAHSLTPAYSYSLDNLSEDEEMAGDSSQSSDSTLPIISQSNSAITTAQLAAALSRAGAPGVSVSNSPSSTSRSSINSSLITTEMFSQAMQQAFATASPPVAPTLPPILPPILPQYTDLQRQLAQMHEMGLQDDTINVQALQFTNGDVQAAIELVFSGFSDN